MPYFTDKAFSSSFLASSKGLSEMIVKKEDDDDVKLTRASSVFAPKYDISDDRGYTSYRDLSNTRQPPPRRDYLSSMLSESKSYDRPPSSHHSTMSSSSSSYSSRATQQSLSRPVNKTKINPFSNVPKPFFPSSSHTQRQERASRYSTVLVRAKSELPSNDEDDISLPVDIFYARGSQPKKREKRIENVYKRTEDTEPVYFSDRHFSNHFLNYNPKLQDMLQKVEK